VERKNKSDWESACRELQVEGTKSKGRGKKTWKVEMKKLVLVKDDAPNGDKGKSLTTGNCQTLPQCGN